MKRKKITDSALLSLVFNIVFAIYNAVLGIVTASWWFITLGAYYVVLSTMRFALIRIRAKSSGKPSYEGFAMRFTGVMFVFLSVCLVGTVILSVVNDRGTKYHEIVMISVALYAFTKITISIINLAKSKRYASPVYKALRNISFANALVSIFALQRSMLVSFGEMSPDNIRLFNILIGSGVCVVILLLGINLIGGKRITMAKSKIAKANEKIADGVVGTYKKVEHGVVGAYKKIEQGVVSGYSKVEDAFVDKYLTKDGESVEDAKERLKGDKK